jgi:hypothetical protein
MIALAPGESLEPWCFRARVGRFDSKGLQPQIARRNRGQKATLLLSRAVLQRYAPLPVARLASSAAEGAVTL